MQFIYRDHALRENMLCNRLVQDCLLESDRDSFCIPYTSTAIYVVKLENHKFYNYNFFF